MSKISDFFIKRKIENFTRMNKEIIIDTKENEKPLEELKIDTEKVINQEEKKDNQI